ncbi:MAG: phosphate ABC transporter permease subunit PstC, partial [Angustibacter sp.]
TNEFGALYLIEGTLVTSLFALLIAVPTSIAIGLFLSELAPRAVRTPVGIMVELLAAIPSVVLGLWGIIVLGPWVSTEIEPWLNDHLGFIPLFSGYPSNAGMLPACFILTIMTVPIISSISRELFNSVPADVKEGALALGATRWEVIRTTVLPFGKPGVISAAMLGLGRALGETIAVTIIVNTLAQGTDWSFSLFNGGETFASKIANNAAEFDSPTKAGAFIAAGLVLFVLTFVVNAIARIIIERRKAFSE